MTVNWALFDSEYKDQQVSTFVGLGFVVTNAASTNIKGLEVDVNWQATEKLKLGLNFALMDGEYGGFPGAGCTAEQASGLLGLEHLPLMMDKTTHLTAVLPSSTVLATKPVLARKT